MINVKQVEIARGNWLKASEELKFKIVTPYLLEINGITKTAFAYLPEYGSPNGVILGLTAAPDYETDEYIKNWAKLNTCFCSFINIEGVLIYKQEYFMEILADWGKYRNSLNGSGQKKE